MATQTACPICSTVLESDTRGLIPYRCPECGARTACPKCRTPLERAEGESSTLHCPSCGSDLTGTETVASTSPTAPFSDTAWSLPGFELRGEVGRGAMGIVYRAWQHSLQREVAIKVLPPALACDPQRLERFRNEAEVAAGVTDSHVVPVFDILEAQGVPILVMPLIDGANLGWIIRDRRAVRQGRPVPEVHPWAALGDRAYLDQVLPLLDQLVDAVNVIHQARVLHRDIKPSNVLVDKRNNLWLSDFGLARLEEKGAGTTPGMIVGTRGFMSPEQGRGEEDIDFRSDVFSLGATIYQALTLEMPYGTERANELASPPIAPSRRQPLLSRDFDAVLLKALERDRERRYRSAAELREDWRRVRQGLPPLASRVGRTQRLLRAARRHPARVLVGLTMALLLGLFAGALFLRGSNPPSPAPTQVYRTVHVQTDPPGARVVLVPLDPDTGFPQPEKAILADAKTPVTIQDVPAGEYLVEAVVAEDRFHEVYRTVPQPGEQNDVDPIRGAGERPDGTIDLPIIKVPPATVTRGMAFFKGGEFTVGAEDVPAVPPHRREVSAFYLDPTEVTVGDFRKVCGALPHPLRDQPPPDSHAVTYVMYHFAVHYAEEVGKRLPDEFEYEFAATRGGEWRFPWSKKAVNIVSWPLGEAGKPAYDHTDTDPQVFGLFSNVAEWTSSWHTLYPGSDAAALAGFYSPKMREVFGRSRIIRGGPFAVVRGDPEPGGRDQGPIWDPRFRFSIRLNDDRQYPGLGFRCARSARPRFLDP